MRTSFGYGADGHEKSNDDALPERKENDGFDTQKFRQRSTRKVGWGIERWLSKNRIDATIHLIT